MGTRARRLFTWAAEDVWLKETFVWDALFALAIHQFSTPLLDRLMDLITQFGELGAITGGFHKYCSGLRSLLFGAEALDPRVLQRLRQITPYRGIRSRSVFALLCT